MVKTLPLYVRTGIASLLVAGCVVAANTEEQRTIAGTWTVKVEAAQGVTPEGGNWSRSAIAGTMVIEKNGDTLTGTWSNGKGEPWAFNGRVQTDKFDLSTTPRELAVVRDGAQGKERYVWRVRGENDHDTLRGTMVLDRDGERSDRFQKFTAVRAK